MLTIEASGVKVAVLLATCNGDRYLAEQLDSIVAQTHQNWCLLIEDDASEDSSREIIQRYCERDPRIVFHDSETGARQGPARRFAGLLQRALESDAQAFAFCDQDDLWHRERLATGLADLSSRHADSVATLVCAGLRSFRGAADQAWCEARMLCSSAVGMGADRFRTYNSVPGCTMLFNRALAELATPVPEAAPMHDWWLALVAAHSGDIIYQQQLSVFYRQHGANAVGAFSLWRLLRDPGRWRREWRRGSQQLEQAMAQAQVLAARLPDDARAGRDLRRFAGLAVQTGCAVLREASALGLRRGKPLLRGLLYLRLLTRVVGR